MRALRLCFAVLGLASVVRADYLESYFAKTSPDSWARYEVTTTDQKGKPTQMHMTLSRLADRDGNVVIEMYSEPQQAKKDKKDKVSTIQIHAKPSVLKEQNPLNFMQHLARLIIQTEGDKAQEMPLEMLQMAASGGMQLFDYSHNVKMLGKEDVAGHSTVHYQTDGKIEIKIAFKDLKYTHVSNLWLSSAVPFGRVKELSVVSDSEGKTRSTTESRLLDSGTSGAVSHVSGEIEKIDMPAIPGLFGK